MEFMSMDDAMRGLAKLLNGDQEEKNMKMLFKLTPEEIARFAQLNAKGRAMDIDLRRMKSKIQAERDRLWADLMDRNDAHGKNLHYKEDEGAIYETIRD